MSTEEKKVNNVPEGEEKLLLDHDFDGIRELNNPPPPWLMLIFYGTIIWSVFYVFHYHILKTGPTQDEEYAEAVKEAESKKPAQVADFDEAKIEVLSDEASIAAGMEKYTKMGCASCHMPNGAGSVGPNLTDNHYLHGNTPEEVFKIIKYGAQGTSMIAYKDQMSDKDIQLITSYILTEFDGKNVENGKAPEGDLYE